MKKTTAIPACFIVGLVLLQFLIARPVFAYSWWATEFADTQGDVGWITSIALDRDDVHIIYADAGRNAVRYAKKTSAGWTTAEVLTSGGDAALALDAAGNPHISYTTSNGSAVGYATKSGNASWVYSSIESSSTAVIRGPAIALGTNGSVHISYRAGTKLKYATKASGSWTTSVVDGGPPLNKNVGNYSSIALDANGNPRISYYNISDKTLMYAQWIGTSWHKDTADFGGDTGWYTSLAIDSRGFPHISYYDSTRRKVKYITWDASGFGNWIQSAAGMGEVVDTVTLGGKTAIVLNGANVPAIAYQGGTGLDFELRYAERTGSGQNKWVYEVVDAGGGGIGVSMDLLTDGYPHLSYSHIVPSSSPISKLKHAYPRINFNWSYVVAVIVPVFFAILIGAGMLMRKRKKALAK